MTEAIKELITLFMLDDNLGVDKFFEKHKNTPKIVLGQVTSVSIFYYNKYAQQSLNSGIQ